MHVTLRTCIEFRERERESEGLWVRTCVCGWQLYRSTIASHTHRSDLRLREVCVIKVKLNIHPAKFMEINTTLHALMAILMTLNPFSKKR